MAEYKIAFSECGHNNERVLASGLLECADCGGILTFDGWEARADNI